MSTLKEKAEQILQEKNEKILPENFSENLTIYGVNGNIEDYRGYDEEHKLEIINNTEVIISEDWGGIFIIKGNINDWYNKGGLIDRETICEAHTSYSTVANAIGLTAEKIKKDEVILGVTGTYEGSGSYDVYSTGTNTEDEYDEETGDMIYSTSFEWLEKNGIRVSKDQIMIDNINSYNIELISR